MTQSHFATPRTVPSGVFVPTIVPAPRGYEELEGAQGREIFFRPQRYTANEFAPVRGEVTLALGAAVVVGEVVDVSQSGVAFRWPDADIPEVGMAVASLRVDFDGRPAFQGPARISSVRGVADGAVVGVSFAHSSLDIDELMQLRGSRCGRPTSLSWAWTDLAGASRGTRAFAPWSGTSACSSKTRANAWGPGKPSCPGNWCTATRRARPAWP
jgi:hypothetical protein